MSLQTESDLREYLINVVRHEGPIQHELLFSRVRTAAGYAKAGRNVRAWLEQLIQQALDEGHLRVAGSAYLMDDTDHSTPRDWSARPSAERKLDYVPDIEIEAALRHVIKSSYGIDNEEAVRSALRLLGFRRTTDDAIQRGKSVIIQMIQSGELIQHNSSVHLVEYHRDAR